MNVYVVYGMTESGDDWMLVFNERPTEARILLEIDDDAWLSGEYEAGCIQGWNISEEIVLNA